MYNEYQLLAIKSEEPNLVIIAPPGSGKTHTMTGAIKEYLDKNKNSIEKVIAVTFTNKATEELKERLFEYTNTLHISTIHSWSYSELQKLSEKYYFRVKLLAEDQIHEILRPLMESHYINMRNSFAVYHHCLGNINHDLPTFVRSKYDAVKDKYIKYKRKMHLYDFTDLPLYLKTKLIDNDEYIYVDALFVDEFQDVDPDQLTVFDRVIADKKFYIGDPDQAIYLFRGATQDIFNRIPNFKVYTLKENYRSYMEILEYAYSFKNGTHMFVSDVSSLIKTDKVIAAKNKGGFVAKESNGLLKIMSKDGLERNAYEDLKEGIRKELENYEYHFLCRKNKEVVALEKLGLSATTVHKAKGLEYDNVIIIDFKTEEEEDVNIGFVALTRAKNRMMILSLETVEYLLEDEDDIKPLNTKRLKIAF